MGKAVKMGIRPEDIKDDPEFIEKHKECKLSADVEVSELMGSEIYLYLDYKGNKMTARVAPTQQGPQRQHRDRGVRRAQGAPVRRGDRADHPELRFGFQSYKRLQRPAGWRGRCFYLLHPCKKPPPGSCPRGLFQLWVGGSNQLLTVDLQPEGQAGNTPPPCGKAAMRARKISK